MFSIWGPCWPFQWRLRCLREAARLGATVRSGSRSKEALLQASRCARCGEASECGAQAGRAHCWCGEFPALSAPTPGSGCYCPRCLKESIEDETP
ncbi:MAG TPA: cysteine-rich CWC family protein [Burkholderiales bacterium]|nr:cysteine-rich CWC family protein [Burkholderiales bacterium]